MEINTQTLAPAEAGQTELRTRPDKTRDGASVQIPGPSRAQSPFKRPIVAATALKLISCTEEFEWLSKENQ
jgi:hypothetical protein